LKRPPIFTTLLVVLFLGAFTTQGRAQTQSSQISLGSATTGNAEIQFLGNTNAIAFLYCDGVLVLTCDPGGVTYAAPGVSASPFGAGFYISGAPSGDYTAAIFVAGPQSYSYGTGTIYWSDAWGNYVSVDFVVY
jgi:hypothetical protein